MKKLPLTAGPYTVDPFDGGPPGSRQADGYDALVTIAGLGGTGAFLAEDLARLFSVHFGWRTRLHLVDHDRVEPHNERRQAFARRDRHRHKALVVAERLVRQFPIEVSLSLAPYDHCRDAPEPRRGEGRPSLALLAGCVDNPAARRELARTLGRRPCWWVDLGNGAASGQIYLGNVLDPTDLHRTFDPATRTCCALPAPSLQAPELLEAPSAPLPAVDPDCAEAQAVGDQEPFVNRVIAGLGLAMVARLCQRRLTWRATFFDLEVGTLSYTSVEPLDLARLLGLRPERLVRREWSAARAA